MIMDTATFYLKAYDRYTEDFVTTFSKFDKARFNTPIREGGWSPGGVMEHLLRAEKGILQLLNGTAVAVANRTADGKCSVLERDILDNSHKIESPASLLPTGTAYAPTELLDKFVDRRADIRVAFDFAADIAGVVEPFPHRMFGTLTVCEWLHFVGLHGERHRRQFAGMAKD